jgi:hypothetical protein
MKNQIKKLLILILVIAFLPQGAFAQSESTIPTNFATYTDEVNFFSISYPANWKPAFSKIEKFKQETDEFTNSIDEEGSLEKSNIVFFGGIPLDSGYYDPNISIFVEPLDNDNMKLEDMVEYMFSEYKRFAEEYREFARTKTIIDGRQAIILDFEVRLLNLPLTHYLVMNMYIGNFLWTTTCTIDPLSYYDFKDDIYIILKSFKRLK